MFAGTGAKDLYPDFINETNTILNSSSEKLLASMLADISRINIDDKVIFYLEGQYKFYGVFKVVSNPFLDDIAPNSFLELQLGRPLPYRVRLMSDAIYPIGISEHDALDSLSGINKPYEMNWSLILRKLKGKRGCTMITDFESDMLISKIQRANNNNPLIFNPNNQKLTFNLQNKEITAVNNPLQYTGNNLSLDITNRLKNKILTNKAHEAHLQSYIIQQLQPHTLRNNQIQELLLSDNVDFGKLWIGNEVSCSVGMQRIDILTIEELNNKFIFNVIELKYVPAEEYIIKEQLPWYIEWLNYYILPLYTSKPVKINPIIIAKKASPRQRRQVYDFNNQPLTIASQLHNNATLNPIKHIKYELVNNNINFMV